MKTHTILILALMLTLISIPVFAQNRSSGPFPDDQQRGEGPFAPNQGQGAPPSEVRRDEVRKKIEAIRIWRLTDELKLDVNTSSRLSSLLGSLDRKRREIQREQMETTRSLQQALRAKKPDEAGLKPLLDKLESNHRAMQTLRESEIKGMKEILTMEQQARYLLFQQEFQREMREMISGARGSGPDGMGRGRNYPDRGSGPGMRNQQLQREPGDDR